MTSLEESEKIIKAEHEYFIKKLADGSLDQYRGLYIAMLNGEVLDSNEDKFKLMRGVYAKHGYQTMLMRKVQEEGMEYAPLPIPPSLELDMFQLKIIENKVKEWKTSTNDYALTIRIPFRATDNIDARLQTKGIIGDLPKSMRENVKLQQIFNNKPPEKIEL